MHRLAIIRRSSYLSSVALLFISGQTFREFFTEFSLRCEDRLTDYFDVQVSSVEEAWEEIDEGRRTRPRLDVKRNEYIDLSKLASNQ